MVVYRQSSSRSITPPPPQKKKRTRPISSPLDRTSLVNKLFITLPRDLCSCATQSGISRGGKVSNPHLAHLGSRSEHRIRYYLARSQDQPIVKQVSTRYICSLLVCQGLITSKFIFVCSSKRRRFSFCLKLENVSAPYICRRRYRRQYKCCSTNRYYQKVCDDK